jgi:AraC-like DNA-binding protein
MMGSLISFFKYLTVSPRDEAWQIYCTDAGYTGIPPGIPYPPRASDHPPEYSRNWERGRILHEYQLIYITRGKGLFRTEKEKQFTISEGTAFMLFPGVWHWYAPNLRTGWDEYWVGFNGAYPRQLQENGFFRPDRPVHAIGLHDSLVHLFQEIFDLVARQPPGYQQQLGALISGILARLVSLGAQRRQDSEDEHLVQSAKLAIEKSIDSSLEVESLGQELGVSYPRFCQIFKEYTGLTPYQYFLQLKIHRAKVLLQDSEQPVKEIAFRLGFDSPYYFSRLFKRKTGLSPALFRANRQGLKTASRRSSP